MSGETDSVSRACAKRCRGRTWLVRLFLLLLSLAPLKAAIAQTAPGVAEQYLFAAMNAERAAQNLAPLRWDRDLYRAAAEHARRMAENRNISHQYSGEPELADRAGLAGVRFSAVLENVGEASTALELHDAWMHSPHHRENLLSPHVDAAAIAVVRSGGQLYAVEDFAHTIRALSLEAQEATVAAVLAAVEPEALVSGNAVARETCKTEQGYAGGRQPGFVMRYTTDDLALVPAALRLKLRSGKFHDVAVGACTRGAVSPFSMYALAVLLYP